jgi:RNA recognition motif-containing protein
MVRLYVGNLSPETNESELAEVFSKYGNVVSIEIAKEEYSGRSKGFGFVNLSDRQMAEKAIEELGDFQINGRSLVLSIAEDDEYYKTNSNNIDRNWTDERD